MPGADTAAYVRRRIEWTLYRAKWAIRRRVRPMKRVRPCDCGLLRESLVLCAEIAGADGEAVEAALSGAMTYPSVAQFAVDSVRQLRADYMEVLDAD